MLGQPEAGISGNGDSWIESGFLGDTLARWSMLTTIEGPNTGLPGTFALMQNFPNPFNPTTEIRFQVPTTTHVTLVVYDLLGRKVDALVDELKQPGVYTVRFNASRFASGIYFCRIVAGNFTLIRKMLLLK